jgi:para-aminobenzoate synthetase component 1
MADAESGRYSYISADPILTLTAKDGRVVAEIDSHSPLRNWSSLLSPIVRRAPRLQPFDALELLLAEHESEAAPDLPPLQTGAFGYFGYDLCRQLEKLPSRAVDDIGMPDLSICLYPWLLAHDHVLGRTWIEVTAPEEDLRAAESLLKRLRAIALAAPSQAEAVYDQFRPVEVGSNFTRRQYLNAIARAKEYIDAGDIYEICLSQRLSQEVNEHPFQLYRRMREGSPVPYGAYLETPDFAIISGSPELFLKLRGRRVETRPMKGTRPRGDTSESDRRLMSELRSSKKERAENLMIVDLLRNDIGRVCRTGSVEVPELFRIHTYSTVHQMVSTVTGELRPGVSAVDLLRAAFPGGSITGCPKIRAMEIIEELEPTRRGVYCGAIGGLAFNGNMDASIVIRTIVFKERHAYIQVGGAIVADSVPEAEYQETLDKAKAALAALRADPNRISRAMLDEGVLRRN